MIAILSPARNVRLLDGAGAKPTELLFPDEAQALAEQLRGYSPWQLESLLDVPPQRAFDLYDAYQNFTVAKGGTPALLAYYGAAYRNMAPQDFSTAQLAFAQEHLRIFSALYGLLRPLDGIRQHRLGLKKAFQPFGGDLHAFWEDKVYKSLFARGQVVVNLASVEYAKLAVAYMCAGDSLLTCRFLVDKPGGARATVSTVRAARGLMARFIVQNGIDTPQGLQEFNADGYRFQPLRSTAAEYVFVKPRAGFSRL